MAFLRLNARFEEGCKGASMALNSHYGRDGVCAGGRGRPCQVGPAGQRGKGKKIETGAVAGWAGCWASRLLARTAELLGLAC